MKKALIAAVLMATLGWSTVVSAANMENAVRQESFVDSGIEVFYPRLTKGDGKDKINKQVVDAVKDLVKSGSRGGTVNYEVHLVDGNTYSVSLVFDPLKGKSRTVGLTFDSKSGKARRLDYYYKKTEALNRAADGLSYMWGVPASRVNKLPDSYYVDIEKNIIAVYKAGSMLPKAEGDLEVNLTIADISKPVVTKPVVTKPVATKPAVTKPVVTKPVVTKPVVTKPVVTKPVATKPVVTQSVVTKPVVKKPVVFKPNIKPFPTPQKGIITGEDVLQRNEAAPNGQIAGTFEKGEKVTMLKYCATPERNWYFVQTEDGNRYWVAAEYCKVVNK